MNHQYLFFLIKQQRLLECCNDPSLDSRLAKFLDTTHRINAITGGGGYLIKLLQEDYPTTLLDGLLDMIAFHPDQFHSQEIAESFFPLYFDQTGVYARGMFNILPFHQTGFVFTADKLLAYLEAYAFSKSLLHARPVTLTDLAAQTDQNPPLVTGSRTSVDLMHANIKSLMHVFLKSVTTRY